MRCDHVCIVLMILCARCCVASVNVCVLHFHTELFASRSHQPTTHMHVSTHSVVTRFDDTQCVMHTLSPSPSVEHRKRTAVLCIQYALKHRVCHSLSLFFSCTSQTGWSLNTICTYTLKIRRILFYIQRCQLNYTLIS